MNNIYLIDTHAHIDMSQDVNETIINAQNNGVKKIIIPSVEEEFFEKIIQIAEANENIFCQLGLYPSEALKWSDSIANKIRLLAKSKKVVAIGEIGLDYYWDKTYVEEQKKMFKDQIILANELNLPIVVHDREAHKDSIDIVKEYNKTSEVIFHCFSGSVEMMKECVKNNWYIALGGVVTFKNAKKMKEVAQEVPLEKLLLETDSPYLTPVPYRGKENQPAYIKYVAEEIANLRNQPVEDIIKITTENAERVFRI